MASAITRHLRGAPVTRRFRPTWVEIDLDAIRHNVGEQSARGAGGGDRGGEGRRVRTRRGAGGGAAVDAGAAALGVALVEEGVELRDAGIDVPILVLSEPARRPPTRWSPGG